MFGPYLIGFMQEKRKPEPEPKAKNNIIVIAGPGKDGQKEISARWIE
jgi:predicted glycosyltransferase